MYATLKRVLIVLSVGLCALSLSFHFVVESVGGIENHFTEGQAHDGDHFVMTEPENKNPVHSVNSFPFRSKLYFISRPLTPLFEPPKLI